MSHCIGHILQQLKQCLFAEALAGGGSTHTELSSTGGQRILPYTDAGREGSNSHQTEESVEQEPAVAAVAEPATCPAPTATL